MYQLGLEIALMKTFAIPTISRILLSTRQFVTNTSRRAEDTDLLLMEITETYARIENEKQRNPELDELQILKQYARSTEAIQRMNELHGKYNILNDDYRYTLAVMIIEPIRWINKYEYRSLDQREINAYFRVWYDVGTAMGIKGIPKSIEKLEAFIKHYEQTNMVYHPANSRIMEAIVGYLLERFPRWMRPNVRELVPCSLESRVIDAFRLDHPGWLLQKLFDGGFYLRGFILRHLFLPRKYHLLRTPFYPTKEGKYVPVYCLSEPEYPEGYAISCLGPERFCPVKRSSSI
ncbi:hypothetical protein EC973_004113 [Apophysomyces ossiformis]|uniref:ER-bound oxygenase mpaB/mpaB'/Rubber oxygenase catalytic domain-containing protein n=1 Tax=Apophysomyces ossiformis TaxID=679940 RepID=A0A8H7BKY3_9FUNG|nr:hypothetical protein EC973_004113 [Apophysomyces ossiformis]